MRCQRAAGAVVLGCAGLMLWSLVGPVLIPSGGLTPAAATSPYGPSGYATDGYASDGYASGGYASGGEDCRAAAGRAGPQSGGLTITTDVPAGATVPPGQVIRVTITWDPNAWSGEQLDAALACVEVKGGLDPYLSGGERPAANDGVYEYRLHVPESIRPDCDICVQGFLLGMGADGGPRQGTSERRCFMSGPPGGPPTTRPPTPPVTQPPTPPATEPPTPPVTSPPETTTTTVRTPTEVVGVTVGQPGGTPLTPAPVPPDEEPVREPQGELPKTGGPLVHLAGAAGGLSLTLGGLAVMGGAAPRRRRRAGS